MGIQTSTGDGGNIGDSRYSEIQSVSVEASEFFDGEVGVALTIGRRWCASRELNFILDRGEEATNAHEPAVLDVVEVGLCVLEHRRVGASFELDSC